MKIEKVVQEVSMYAVEIALDEILYRTLDSDANREAMAANKESLIAKSSEFTAEELMAILAWRGYELKRICRF